MLGVDPAARARGVARALMAASEERARAAGKTFITLHTTLRMQAAQAMYERLGYERRRTGSSRTGSSCSATEEL